MSYLDNQDGGEDANAEQQDGKVNLDTQTLNVADIGDVKLVIPVGESVGAMVSYLGAPNALAALNNAVRTKLRAKAGSRIQNAKDRDEKARGEGKSSTSLSTLVEEIRKADGFIITATESGKPPSFIQEESKAAIEKQITEAAAKGDTEALTALTTRLVTKITGGLA